MNEHLDFWIDAYLDDELLVGMIPGVEAHLLTCEKCRNLLQERKELALLLAGVPAAKPMKSDYQFLAELDKKLLGEPAVKSIFPDQIKAWLGDDQFKFIAWSGVSLVILLASLFFQTVGLLSEALSILPVEYKVLFDQLISTAAGSQPIIPGPMQAVLGGAGFFGLLDLNGLSNMFVLLVLSLLNVIWLVIRFLMYPPKK